MQAEAVCPLAGGTEYRYTIAEGIAVKQPGTLTASILSERLDEIVTVTDEQISLAILLLLERTKLLVEGAGAAPVAAVLAGKVPGDDEACLVLSGGNIDPTLLIQVMRHGLTQAGRYLVAQDSDPRPARRADQAPPSSSPRSARTSSRSSTTGRGWRCRYRGD